MRQMDPVSLSHETTEMLIAVQPTVEEVELVKQETKGGRGELGRAERFVSVLGTVPRLRQRLSCHEITFRLASQGGIFVYIGVVPALATCIVVYAEEDNPIALHDSLFAALILRKFDDSEAMNNVMSGARIL